MIFFAVITVIINIFTAITVKMNWINADTKSLKGSLIISSIKISFYVISYNCMIFYTTLYSRDKKIMCFQYVIKIPCWNIGISFALNLPKRRIL